MEQKYLPVIDDWVYGDFGFGQVVKYANAGWVVDKRSHREVFLETTFIFIRSINGLTFRRREHEIISCTFEDLDDQSKFVILSRILED